MFFYKNGAFEPTEVNDFQWIASEVILPLERKAYHQVCTFDKADEIWLALPGQRFIILQGDDFVAYLKYLQHENSFVADRSINSAYKLGCGNIPQTLLSRTFSPPPADTPFLEDTPMGLEDDHPIEDNDDFIPEDYDA